MEQDRRAFLKTSGLGLLAFSVGGASLLMTAAEARAKNVPLKVLTADEARTLEALGETLGVRRVIGTDEPWPATPPEPAGPPDPSERTEMSDWLKAGRVDLLK